MMHKSFRMLITAILSLVLLLLIPYAAIADGPADENAPVTPKIEVEEDGWLVISFSGKVPDKAAAARQLDSFLANALAEMVSSKQDITATDGGGFGLRGGQNYMEMAEEVDYHPPDYVRGWFGTGGVWFEDNLAYFGGSSSSAWFGTDPYNCDEIHLLHQVWPGGGIIVGVPDEDWTNQYNTAFSDTDFWVEDTWYLGTGWSPVVIYCPYSTYFGQATESIFCWGYDSRTTYPRNYMVYGD